MNISQRIIKNIIALTASSVLFAAALFIFNILVARYLGDIAFGKYSLAIAFTSLFAFISHLGLPLIVTRDIALDRSRATAYFSNVFFLQIVLSIVAFMLIALAASLMQWSSDTKVIVYIVAIGTITMSFIMLCRAIFRAFEKMEWDTVASILGAGFILATGWFLLQAGYGLLESASVYTVAQILMFLFSLAIVKKKFTGLNISIQLRFWGKLIRATIPFAMNGFLLAIYNRLDIVLLASLKTNAEVGWYNAAYTLSVATFLIISTAISRALFPSITHAYVYNKERYISLVENTRRYCIAALVPIGIIATLVPGQIVSIVFGQQFTTAADILRFLIWVGILLFLNYLHINTMEATGKQKMATLLLSIGAIMNIVLNVILIPPFGAIGTALASLITQAAFLLGASYIVGQLSEIKKLAISLVRPLVAAALMVIPILFLSGLNTIPRVILGTALYLLTYYLIGGITKKDRELFRDLVTSNNDKNSS